MPISPTVPQTSADLTADLIKALRAQVPHVFTEVGVDLDKLKAALGENVVDSKERYGLTWAGKADISVLAGKPVRLRLRMRSAKLYAFEFGESGVTVASRRRRKTRGARRREQGVGLPRAG